MRRHIGFLTKTLTLAKKLLKNDNIISEAYYIRILSSIIYIVSDHLYLYYILNTDSIQNYNVYHLIHTGLFHLESK